MHIPPDDGLPLVQRKNLIIPLIFAVIEWAIDLYISRHTQNSENHYVTLDQNILVVGETNLWKIIENNDDEH